MTDPIETQLGGETSSIWHGTFAVPEFAALTRDRRADVCVVGAGIAGLSTAYALARGGKKVIVLDDGPIGGGETGRTTAHITAAMDDRIYRLEHMHGEEGARRIVESHTAAINQIERIVNLEKIDCEFRRVDGFLFLGPRDSADTLRREYEAAKRAGLADVELVDRAPIAGVETGQALRFPEQGQFHPLRYVTGLALAIVRLGGEIFSGSHVKSIEGRKQGNPCTVETESGHTVTADAVCVCTNASISDYVRTHALMAPYRTFVVAAVVPRGTVTPALYWDTADPYHYARVQPLDAPDAGLLKGDTLFDALVVGGEDHKTAHTDDADKRWGRLERWMRERWPQAREVIYRWSGQVLEPSDGAAFIGPNPDGAEGVYMASGDSGQGMTHGTIAGMLLGDILLGRSNPWATVYDPRRISLRAKSVKEVVKENVDVAAQYVVDYIKPGSSVEDIPPGEGRVVRRGVHRVAVYRDPSGTLHEKSAVCTHLRCIVDWNSAEKSWDCPCHGSRFDPHGRVMNGPAIEPLADVE